MKLSCRPAPADARSWTASGLDRRDELDAHAPQDGASHSPLELRPHPDIRGDKTHVDLRAFDHRDDLSVQRCTDDWLHVDSGSRTRRS